MVVPSFTWSYGRIQELHGSSLWGVGSGWLVDLVLQDARGQVVPLLEASMLISQLEENLPWLKPGEIDSLNEGIAGKKRVSLALCCEQLARLMISPVRVDSRAVASGFRPAIEGRFLQASYQDLLGLVLKLSLRMLVSALRIPVDVPPSPGEQLRLEARQLAEMATYLSRHALTNAVVSYAHQRGLVLQPLVIGLGEWPILQLGTGCYSRLLMASACDADSFFALHICRDKAYAHQALSRLGFPLPRQFRLSSPWTDRQIAFVINILGYPCVVKPCDAERGRGVTVGIGDEAALRQALGRAQAYTKGDCLVEQHVEGAYHRMVVIAHQLVRVLRVEPPFVVGDGFQSIQQLIEQANHLHLQEGAQEFAIKPVALTASVIAMIARGGFTPGEILPAGIKLCLSDDLQDRADWICSECLEFTHPSLVRLAVSISQALAISNVGVDIISTDITCPLQRGCTKVIELNAIQTLNPRWAATLLDRLLPPDQICHIPVRVVLCVGEADWPDHSWIEAALRECPGYTLAVSNRLASLGDLEALSSDWSVIVYGHPREPLMNRSLSGLLFLLDWRQFIHSGLPVAQGVERIDLRGTLPPSQAAQWRRFCATLQVAGNHGQPEG